MSNNKRRLLSLLKILINKTDSDHHLTEGDIKSLLNEEGISVNNRKTLYEDIETLNDYDYDIQYDTKDHGYYLEEAPFSLSEIKILTDHVNSLKNFDGKDKLQDKLNGFISSYEAQLLKDNQIIIREGKSPRNREKRPDYCHKYTDKLNCILKSIKKHHYLEIIYGNKTHVLCPCFLHYSNGRYYLYALFDDSKEIYQYRLDRISYLKEINREYKADARVTERIRRRIRTSSDNYSRKDIQLLKLTLNRNYEELSLRLGDDFPEHYLDNEGNLILEYSVNNVFFSRLVSYGTDLKIKAPQEVREAYLEYLNNIVNNY